MRGIIENSEPLKLRPGENIALQHSILRTLLYFDIFRYPLKPDEVYKFLGTNSITLYDLHDAMESLVEKGHAYHHRGFYSIQQGEDLVKRRLNGNDHAKKLTGFAKRRAALIGRFPFVRGVMASGSFSKGYMDEHSDLDFFVVTAPGRLWIARMMIVLFKRLFLFNSHKYFCCNYFVDTEHLQIEEKNLFTATELATLIPLYGAASYDRLMAANTWLKDFFPNFTPGTTEQVPEDRTRSIKALIENLLGGRLGERLANYFRKLTLQRWRRLYAAKYPADDFDIAFKTTVSVSKNHPNHFQRKILERYNQRLLDFSRNKFGMAELTDW
jgi:hypothetical protein